MSRRAQLVPVFSFGENELFDQMTNPAGSPLRWLQDHLQRLMGVALPMFTGRGVFQYSFGLLPYREPIHTVGKTHTQLSLIPHLSPLSLSSHIPLSSLTSLIPHLSHLSHTSLPSLAHLSHLSLTPRSPLTSLTSLSLVDRPIPVVQTPSPTKDDIDGLHSLYLEGLTTVFEDNKENYGIAPDKHLHFI